MHACTHMHTYQQFIYTHYHCHHHTVQVAMRMHPYVFVHISKWASWHNYKEHHQCKLQVMTTMSAGEVFVLVDGRKTPPLA